MTQVADRRQEDNVGHDAANSGTDVVRSSRHFALFSERTRLPDSALTAFLCQKGDPSGNGAFSGQYSSNSISINAKEHNPPPHVTGFFHSVNKGR